MNADGRQLRLDRRRDRGGARRLRQRQEVPDVPPLGEHRRDRAHDGRDAHRVAAPAFRRADPLRQPRHRRSARPRPGRRPAGARPHAAGATGPADRRVHPPGRGTDAHRWRVVRPHQHQPVRWALASGRPLEQARPWCSPRWWRWSFPEGLQPPLRPDPGWVRPFVNRWLNLAILWESALLLAIIHVPVLQGAFGTVTLDPLDWAVILGVAVTIVPGARAREVVQPEAARVSTGSDEVRSVVADRTHGSAHRPRGETWFRHGRQEGPDLVRVGERGIEPGVEQVRRHDHGGAVVDVAQRIGGGGGHDGAGPQPRGGIVRRQVRVLPPLVEPREGEGGAVGVAEEPGLLAPPGGVQLLPLVVALRRRMRRWWRAAVRKAGFVRMVSERALIIRLPMEGSDAQGGTRPHRAVRS